jgi:hypothetical protein
MTAMTATTGGSSDPDDAALLAALDLAQAEAWHALAELTESFRLQPHVDDDCVWSGGHPRYGARVDAARRRLSEVGAVTALYPWMRAERPSLGADGQLGPAEAVRLATTIIRAERFGDGMIASALDEGILQAVIAPLSSWYDDRHGPRQR